MASTEKWTAADLPDLSGKTAIVTGANSGLGLVTSRELARAGARVVLAVRDTDRGAEAASSITGETDVRRLDLSDLNSVREFAADWTGPVDILVNNAGVMAIPEQRTAEGFELQLATNHLGPFALTNLLVPVITDRVVTVSSAAHKMGRIHFDDLQLERGYKPWDAYGQSKLANLLFTLELQRRLAGSGSAIRALAAHPGYAATNLQSHSTPVGNAVMSVLNKVVAQSDEMGALPTLFAAVADLPGASYVGPDGFGEQRGHPTLVGRTAAASNPDAARRLWTMSEDLTGVSFPHPLLRTAS